MLGTADEAFTNTGVVVKALLSAKAGNAVVEISQKMESIASGKVNTPSAAVYLEASTTELSAAYLHVKVEGTASSRTPCSEAMAERSMFPPASIDSGKRIQPAVFVEPFTGSASSDRQLPLQFKVVFTVPTFNSVKRLFWQKREVSSMPEASIEVN